MSVYQQWVELDVNNVALGKTPTKLNLGERLKKRIPFFEWPIKNHFCFIIEKQRSGDRRVETR